MGEVDATHKHEHSGIDTEKDMDKDKDKIEHLLEHWIEHNEGHSESFRKWAGKIRDMGFGDVADTIIDAADAMDESTAHLLYAQHLVDSDDG